MNEKRKKRKIQGDPGLSRTIRGRPTARRSAALHRRWTVKHGIYGGSCGEDNVVIVRVHVRQRDKSRNEKGNRGSRGRDATATATFVLELVQGLRLQKRKKHRCCKWSDSIKTEG